MTNDNKIVIDQMNEEVNISSSNRIVSLVPSQTELLFHLGLEKEVVGITKFCIKPDQWFKEKERVGGTKKLNIDKIVELKPDLIIGNKEENTKEDIEKLKELGFSVWMSDIFNMKDNLEMINAIGEITNKPEKAQEIVSKIESQFNQLNPTNEDKTVLYFIWKSPFFLVGPDTFIDSQLQSCGFKNLAKESRYPEMTVEEINDLKPDYLFFSSEPFPFSEKHLAELEELFPHSKCILVDGEMFSWTGSRQMFAADYFNDLIESLT